MIGGRSARKRVPHLGPVRAVREFSRAEGYPVAKGGCVLAPGLGGCGSIRQKFAGPAERSGFAGSGTGLAAAELVRVWPGSSLLAGRCDQRQPLYRENREFAPRWHATRPVEPRVLVSVLRSPLRAPSRACDAMRIPGCERASTAAHLPFP